MDFVDIELGGAKMNRLNKLRERIANNQFEIEVLDRIIARFDHGYGLMECVRSDRNSLRWEEYELRNLYWVVAELCVVKNLPAGDPCWMAKMICEYI